MNLDWTRSGAKACLLAGIILISSSPAAWSQSEVNDPLEPVNRAIFGFNQVVDGLILDPVQQVYGYVIPDPAKQGIRNVLDNLSSPLVFINDVLQGEGDRAGSTLSRFLINTTFGVGGIFDAARAFGLPAHHDEDFGQTLGSYGLGGGPYLVLPLLGPSNLRDLVGRGVDMTISPLGYVFENEVLIGRFVTDGIDIRHTLDPLLDDLEANSLDLYAATRSVYNQRRTADILNGAAPPPDDSYEDIFDEDF